MIALSVVLLGASCATAHEASDAVAVYVGTARITALTGVTEERWEVLITDESVCLPDGCCLPVEDDGSVPLTNCDEVSWLTGAVTRSSGSACISLTGTPRWPEWVGVAWCGEPAG